MKFTVGCIKLTARLIGSLRPCSPSTDRGQSVWTAYRDSRFVGCENVVHHIARIQRDDSETNSRQVTRRRRAPLAVVGVAVAAGAFAQLPIPQASAAPAPEVEYTYDVVVRRHFDFPNNDAIGYGYGVCDKVIAGESFAQIMGEVKRDISPNDEDAANYVVSYAVGLLCPAQIWVLRDSAARYRPPA